MQTLVTGATGLVGSHIVDRLRERGHAVRALVRRTSDTSYLREAGVELAYGDVTDRASLDGAMRGCDAVFHAAAMVSDFGYWPEFQRFTIDGTRSVLDAAGAAGVRRFVHVSSVTVYGVNETEGMLVTEETPYASNPWGWDYYTRAKIVADREVLARNRTGEFETVSLRLGWIYGPRDRVSFPRLANLIRTGRGIVIGNGGNRLVLSYAGDVAGACVLAATAEAAPGRAYNVSGVAGGVPVTQNEYLAGIARAVGVGPPRWHVPFAMCFYTGFGLEALYRAARRRNPPLLTRYAACLAGRDYQVDCSRARTELGWEPQVSLDEGIGRTMAWLDRGRTGAAAGAPS